MGLLLRGADTVYALRFLRLLTMPWEKTAAFKMGIVDENGNRIKKPETSEEKEAYTIFHRLVFNIRRLLSKIPIGKSTIARYLAAFWLIKENTKMSDNELAEMIEKSFAIDPRELQLDEDVSLILNEDGNLNIGTYILLDDIALPQTGDILAFRGTRVSVKEETAPIGGLFGVPIFSVLHRITGKKIFVTDMNIIPENTTTSAIAGKPMPFKKSQKEYELDSDEE